jgi:hypothetical protein
MLVFSVNMDMTLLNDIARLNPGKIVLQGTGVVTIDGTEKIRVEAAIVNYSTYSEHVFNVPVEFAGEINVSQTGTYSGTTRLSGNPVCFAGGVTGTSVSGLVGHTSSNTKLYIFSGHYEVPGWTWDSILGGDAYRHMVAPGSSVSVSNILTGAMFIENGGAVTTATASVSSSNGERLWAWNLGEFVVTNQLNATLASSANI